MWKLILCCELRIFLKCGDSFRQEQFLIVLSLINIGNPFHHCNFSLISIHGGRVEKWKVERKMEEGRRGWWGVRWRAQWWRVLPRTCRRRGGTTAAPILSLPPHSCYRESIPPEQFRTVQSKSEKKEKNKEEEEKLWLGLGKGVD